MLTLTLILLALAAVAFAAAYTPRLPQWLQNASAGIAPALALLALFYQTGII